MRCNELAPGENIYRKILLHWQCLSCPEKGPKSCSGSLAVRERRGWERQDIVQISKVCQFLKQDVFHSPESPLRRGREEVTLAHVRINSGTGCPENRAWIGTDWGIPTKRIRGESWLILC